MTHGVAPAWGRFWREHTSQPQVSSSSTVWSMYWLVYGSLLRTAASWAMPRSWASTASTPMRRRVALRTWMVQNQVGSAGASRNVQE